MNSGARLGIIDSSVDRLLRAVIVQRGWKYKQGVSVLRLFIFAIGG
ncbi:hypothetical protein PCH70_25900 [Pseudomonas cichorii JBC1]|nr:hypothetical protein PCH70_25900 [Pseudomonas cichorii JBC1]